MAAIEKGAAGETSLPGTGLRNWGDSKGQSTDKNWSHSLLSKELCACIVRVAKSAGIVSLKILVQGSWRNVRKETLIGREKMEGQICGAESSGLPAHPFEN